MGELFCGPGGLAWGAINSKVAKNENLYSIKHAWASDCDQDSCRTYVRNICPDRSYSVICNDVRQLNLNLLPSISAFTYGFPCNDFSVVGERKGINGSFGPLYSYGVQVIDKFKPKFFVAENVGGLRNANEGKAFIQILTDLGNAGPGYILTTHLYRFEEYGIPQTRHRVIIVGFKKSLGLKFAVPAPITLNNYLSAKSALEFPPIPKNSPNNELTSQGKVVVERLRNIKPGQNAWTADLPPALQLNVKNTRLSHIYRRLDPNKPSYTITGSGGGGTHGYHWAEPRALTNRERARLQTFPDGFVFEGSKESVRKQIGMAVSPRMSAIIFTAVLKSFAGVGYASVQENFSVERNLFNELIVLHSNAA